VRLFSHEVADLEPLLVTVQRLGMSTTWESRYVLLLWLSLTTRIPFDLERFNVATGQASWHRE
jgi:hypothetical protein